MHSLSMGYTKQEEVYFLPAVAWKSSWPPYHTKLLYHVACMSDLLCQRRNRSLPCQFSPFSSSSTDIGPIFLLLNKSPLIQHMLLHGRFLFHVLSVTSHISLSIQWTFPLPESRWPGYCLVNATWKPLQQWPLKALRWDSLWKGCIANHHWIHYSRWAVLHFYQSARVFYLVMFSEKS